jgi:hypothetical protein
VIVSNTMGPSRVRMVAACVPSGETHTSVVYGVAGGGRSIVPSSRRALASQTLGGRRWLVTPRRINQSANGDHGTGPDQERAENPAGDRPPDRYRPVRAVDHQRAKNPHQHAHTLDGVPPAVTHLWAIHHAHSQLIRGIRAKPSVKTPVATAHRVIGSSGSAQASSSGSTAQPSRLSTTHISAP